MNAWLPFVASNVIVATLIALLAWQVGRRGRRAWLAHLLWVAFFVKLVTPPIVLLPINVPSSWLPATAGLVTDSIPYRSFSPQRLGRPDGVTGQRAPLASSISRGKPRSGPWGWIPRISTSGGLVSIWIIGCGLVLVRGMVRFVRFHRLLLSEGSEDEQASAQVRLLLREVRPGRRGPRVLRIPIRVSPMLFGFGVRPAIVCPDQLWRSLSAGDRQAFLAHEAAHYHRRDHWVRWLEWIVTAIYWWLPLVYVARQQLERHEEACCDAWAVRRLGCSPRQYAEALLRVVDFVSEHNARVPRLASGMQPTESLAERLRLLMRGQAPDEGSSPGRVAVGTACLSLWLVHPIALPSHALDADVTPETRGVASAHLVDPPAVIPAGPHTIVDEPKLPDPPQGFWNRRPDPTWADFSLRLPGARLVAQSARGIWIEVPGRDPLGFSTAELSAIAEIPATQRVVIGDRAGRLRLWDLSAGMPVSLIGQHTAAVTSMAYNETVGLVAADESGSVMRWDAQSGQVLAIWSAAGSAPTSSSGRPAVQSVRFSGDGSMLAIVTGRWSDAQQHQLCHFVDGRSLQAITSVEIESGTAVVLQSSEFGWITVDWSGNVRSIEGDASVMTVEKHHVSALVLSHSSRLPTSVPSVH